MVTWVLYLSIGIVIGGMAGFYFAKLSDLSKKQKLALENKLQQTEQELVAYKDQVSSHFRETASLINTMTESYQKVHEHLVKGSVELCNHTVEVNTITVSPSQLLANSDSKIPDTMEVTADNATADQAESEAPNVVTHPQQQVDNNKNRAKRTNLENRDNKIKDVNIASNDSQDDINSSATQATVDNMESSVMESSVANSSAITKAVGDDQTARSVDRTSSKIDAASPGLSPLAAKTASSTASHSAHDENGDSSPNDMVVTETMAVAEDFDEKSDSHSQHPDGRTVH